MQHVRATENGSCWQNQIDSVHFNWVDRWGIWGFLATSNPPGHLNNWSQLWGREWRGVLEFFNDALNVKVCYVIGLYSSVCCVFPLCNPPCHFYVVLLQEAWKTTCYPWHPSHPANGKWCQNDLTVHSRKSVINWRANIITGIGKTRGSTLFHTHSHKWKPLRPGGWELVMMKYRQTERMM